MPVAAVNIPSSPSPLYPDGDPVRIGDDLLSAAPDALKGIVDWRRLAIQAVGAIGRQNVGDGARAAGSRVHDEGILIERGRRVVVPRFFVGIEQVAVAGPTVSETQVSGGRQIGALGTRQQGQLTGIVVITPRPVSQVAIRLNPTRQAIGAAGRKGTGDARVLVCQVPLVGAVWQAGVVLRCSIITLREQQLVALIYAGSGKDIVALRGELAKARLHVRVALGRAAFGGEAAADFYRPLSGVLFEDDVDHPGDRVGAVNGRTAAF